MALTQTRPTGRDLPAGVSDAAGRPEWGSDLVMDLLRLLDIEYASVLPGSTFRGIHDSAVNYTVNTRPELILCNHKRVAMRMEDPEVDFGAIARTFGLHGEGPIKDAAEIVPAVRRAVAVVKEGGFAVVDVWTEQRSHG